MIVHMLDSTSIKTIRLVKCNFVLLTINIGERKNKTIKRRRKNDEKRERKIDTKGTETINEREKYSERGVTCVRKWRYKIKYTYMYSTRARVCVVPVVHGCVVYVRYSRTAILSRQPHLSNISASCPR